MRAGITQTFLPRDGDSSGAHVPPGAGSRFPLLRLRVYCFLVGRPAAGTDLLRTLLGGCGLERSLPRAACNPALWLTPRRGGCARRGSGHCISCISCIQEAIRAQSPPRFLPLHAAHQPLRELPQAVERRQGSRALLVPVQDGNPGYGRHTGGGLWGGRRLQPGSSCLGTSRAPGFILLRPWGSHSVSLARAARRNVWIQ